MSYRVPEPPPSSDDDRRAAAWLHLLGIPFGAVAGLVGFLLLRRRGPFLRHHAVLVLDFQLTVLIGIAVGAGLLFVLVGFLVLLAVALMSLAYGILGARAARRGERFRYPVAIPFVREEPRAS